MDVSCFGDPSNSLYCFKVWDHRTEGRIYINKRDLHLYEKDQEESYGRTQGDGTLEGAVYGLFAAADIVHPDGRSGVIYQKDDLTAVAATDQDGNASFFAYTEVPHTVVKEDGTIEHRKISWGRKPYITAVPLILLIMDLEAIPIRTERKKMEIPGSEDRC